MLTILSLILDPLGNNVKSIIAHSDSLDGEVTEYSVFYTPQEHGKYLIVLRAINFEF